MMLKIYPDSRIPETVLVPLADALNDGEIIIIPTDTRYSICCDAMNGHSVEHLAELKGIDAKKSTFSILCADISQVSKYAKLSDEAFKVLKDNTPGPFTFVLPVGSSLPPIYKGRKEVGVRIPKNILVQELIQFFGRPLTGFSLPLMPGKDEEYLYHPELIQDAWHHHVAHIVDGGIGELNGSAIIDCTKEPFELLREGPKSVRW